MSKSNNKRTPQNVLGSSGVSRRSFLKYAGASAAAAATFGLVGCDEDEVPGGGMGGGNGDAVNLGSGDVGVLNFAYALEQLEAAFYIQVMDNPYPDMTDEEAQILGDVRAHEVAHRDWFAAALNSVAPNDIIPGLTPNFESIDFSNKDQVLATAMALEDTGVGAYNGAGRFIQNPDYLVQAGKIVSVEARHAAAIRDLINPGTGSFAGDDVIDENGLDRASSIDDVLAAAGPFITEELDASNVGQ